MSFPVLFAAYWVSVLVWCAMAQRLSDLLSQRHPLVYAALGHPAAVAAPGMRREIAVLGFLLRRRDRFVYDRSLARLCGFMRGFLVAYSLFFLTLPAFVLQR